MTALKPFPAWAKLIGTAFNRSQLEALSGQTRHLPHFALLGRSNVGKSTLLNFLTLNHKLAKVSATPGKTQSCNFFNLEDRLCLVDLPGIGYTRRRDLEERFFPLVDGFLKCHLPIWGFLHLIDSRHLEMEMDLVARDWLMSREIPTAIILTKCDKVTRAAVGLAKKTVSATHGVPREWIFGVSSLKKTGREAVAGFLLERAGEIRIIDPLAPGD